VSGGNVVNVQEMQGQVGFVNRNHCEKYIVDEEEERMSG
jgi:hypothetical protein